MIEATLNGQTSQFEDGVTILDACRSVGLKIPTLCNDPRLKPIGSCRMCLVQVEGRPHPLTSCNTHLTQGMVISTHTPALEHERQTLLRMLAKDHPADVFRRFPEKPFHQLALRYGLTEKDFDGVHHNELLDDSHPYIHVDMSQCILCYRCVRICDEVQGQFVWQTLNRGHETRIVPDSGATLAQSSCVSCGACVDTCPTGALEDKSTLERGVATAWTRTTCAYCGIGCEMLVGTTNNHLISMKPAVDAPVSKGHLCVKGRYAFDFVTAKDRITAPMIRTNGTWQPVSWDEAISFTANKLRQIVSDHGPDSVAILGSARGTNEENYLAQKFARVVIGTNNVDCCARVCHTPTAAAMKLMLGTGAATNSYDDIERAQTILLCGTNATENHPIIGARIKQAALRGANLIIIDPRTIELARYAKLHLQCRPGTNVPLLNAIACVIVTEGLADAGFINERVSEWPEFIEYIKEFSPEHVEDICGIKSDLIYDAARLYSTAKPSICFHGLGLTEHVQGTEGVMCLVNLALLTGNIGKRGTGINPLRGQNNVQGAAHMGCDPGVLTGSVSLHQERERFENVWGASIPASRGLNLLEMMDAAAAGRLKALWAIGYDIALTNANASTTAAALKSLDLLVVQDMFLNETARQSAHVFLPAASSFERDGTFMNAERRIQRIRKVIDPLGMTQPDWQIICAVAKAMGQGAFFDFDSPEAIWDEVRCVWPDGNGISYRRLEDGGVQWPCPNDEHPGTQVMHGASFPIGERAALRRIPFRPTEEQVNEQFPFLLITGRTLYQFNAGTMTMRTPNVELRPADVVEISAWDAAQLKLETGQRVRIYSRYGEAILPVVISSGVKSGQLFATFHTAEVFLNRVTSPHRDRYVKTPEYKITAVQIDPQINSPEANPLLC
jgi:formate dehydrogenase major subunit